MSSETRSVKMNPADIGDDNMCVTIAKVEKERGKKRMRVDKDALSRILRSKELSDKPLMVVSVAGSLRKGKSFILSFLQRYLQNYGQNGTDWLGSEPLRDGFKWGSGKTPVTTGIIMWRKPFFVKDETGQTVAVLLIDTQGLFDRKLGKKMCTAVFAFSTLLSSVQVFNVSKEIEDSHLEYLDLFVSYAAQVKSLNEEKSQGRPFQKLTFLVRDWPHVRDHKYGEDIEVEGKSYLSSILENDEDEDDGVDRGDDVNLRKSFDHLGCFLMPHPGQIVDEGSDFKGEIKDIGPNFTRCAKEFAQYMFRQENVIRKTIGGREVTANDLLNYANSFGKLFEEGKFPEVASIKEVTTTALCIQALHSLLKDYDDGMLSFQQEQDETYISGEKLKQKNSLLVACLLEKWKSQMFGDGTLVGRYEKELRQGLKGRFKVLCEKENAKLVPWI